MTVRPKVLDLLHLLRTALRQGRYVISDHAWQRSKDRAITVPDMKHVLLLGFHESAKDQWSEEFATWKYSIQGKTRDGEVARIIVALHSEQDSSVAFVVITIIRLEAGFDHE